MMFVGRITKDAVVNQLKDERKVVYFSVAINDYYKPKDKEVGVSTTLFVNCSYWISQAIVSRLQKGALVEIEGRPSLNAYKALDGEARATLNCHVNSIKIHQSMKQEGKLRTEMAEPTIDLPF